MCGIVGCIYNNDNGDAIDVVTRMLKRIQYRGYDSYGIAYQDKFNSLNVYKFIGSIDDNSVTTFKKNHSNLAFAHTRWCTCGSVNIQNAHPHTSMNGLVTLVHNGIIENASEIRSELIEKGYKFYSETDTEVIANLIEYYIIREMNNDVTTLYIQLNFERLLNENILPYLKGSYALIISLNDLDTSLHNDISIENYYIDKTNKNLYLITNGMPLCMGTNESKTKLVFASDEKVFDEDITLTHRLQLSDKERFVIENTDNQFTQYRLRTSKPLNDNNDISGFKYNMLREIYEERFNFETLMSSEDIQKKLYQLNKYINKYTYINFIACGSSYHAGLIIKYLITKYKSHKSLKHFEVNVYDASELNYDYSEQRRLSLSKSLNIFISQSGETADIISCAKFIKKYWNKHNKNICIVNSRNSTLESIIEETYNIEVDVEQAVASTKAFFGTCVLFACALYYKNQDQLKDYFYLKDLFEDNFVEHISNLADKYKDIKGVYLIGRGIDYYICKEGSLKIKEITYVDSEALAGGELKHGTLALLDDTKLVIAISNFNEDKIYKSKMSSNILEAKSRGCKTLLITDEVDSNLLDDKGNCVCNDIIVLPNKKYIGFESIIPIQFFAYYLCVALGHSPDMPRNLAKSVTVE